MWPATDIIVESVESQPWASLTFAGERHRLVVRLTGGTVPADAIDAANLVVAGAIIAVAGASWSIVADGVVLTLDLLAIAEAPPIFPSSV